MIRAKCVDCGEVYPAGQEHECDHVTDGLSSTPKTVEGVIEIAARGTYKYRDPDKWRAYMREYMRRRRVTDS